MKLSSWLKSIKGNTQKVFILSHQRTGTTSVGGFFSHHGYKVSTWDISNKNEWSRKWYIGDFESIFNSTDFIKNQVFEDDPWFLPDFYKILYHRFPSAKFVLFQRSSEDWFNSMLRHSGGKSLGISRIHAKVYRRELEYFNLPPSLIEYHKSFKIDNLLELNNHKEHYKHLYDLRNNEIVEFFSANDQGRLITLKLDDEDKWTKLAKFFKLNISNDFSIHLNKSS
jgi:hypothetical protein